MTHPNETQIGGSHYKGRELQPWDLALHGVGYFEVSAIAYVVRFREKGGIEDLHKAGHYIDKISYHFEEAEYMSRAATHRIPDTFVRHFNRLNFCDRWQSEVVSCLINWIDENDLIDARRALTELIQCADDDFNHHHEQPRMLVMQHKPTLDRDDLVAREQLKSIVADDGNWKPLPEPAPSHRRYTQAEVDAILAAAVAAPPEPEKQPFRPLPPTRFPKSWDKEDGTFIKNE